MIFVFSLIVVETAMTYYSVVMANRNKEIYNEFTNDLSSTVAAVVDRSDYDVVRSKVNDIYIKINKEDVVTSEETDENLINQYMEKYASLETDALFQESFNRLRTQLVKISNSNKDFDVTSVYLIYVAPFKDAQGVDQAHFIYLVDSAEADPCPPGWVDPLYEENRQTVLTPEIGFPAYETNTNYGHLITAGTLIEGTDRGYAMVDISMTAVRAKQADSIVRLFLYLSITVLLIAIVGVVVVYFIFTRPIKRIQKVANSFENNDPVVAHDAFKKLKVGTRDEIEDLANAMKDMEENIHQRMEQLVEMNEALHRSKVQTAKMSALANKDALTGVQSKIAYHSAMDELNEQVIKKEHVEFGIAMIDLNYLKVTNDEFGHVAGDEALIHLANTICLTFKHSPVYRYGGDEFVAILKNDDYKHSKELIDEFNERIDDSIKNTKIPVYERVSAAIGYAQYDPKVDKSVDDVFNRADREMYKRKHDMKEK